MCAHWFPGYNISYASHDSAAYSLWHELYLLTYSIAIKQAWTQRKMEIVYPPTLYKYMWKSW